MSEHDETTSVGFTRLASPDGDLRCDRCGAACSNRFHRRPVTDEIYARELRCPKCGFTVHWDYTTDRLNELRRNLAHAQGVKRRIVTNYGRRLAVHDDAILRAEEELKAEALRVGLPDRAAI